MNEKGEEPAARCVAITTVYAIAVYDSHTSRGRVANCRRRCCLQYIIPFITLRNIGPLLLSWAMSGLAPVLQCHYRPELGLRLLALPLVEASCTDRGRGLEMRDDLRKAFIGLGAIRDPRCGPR